MNLVKTIASCLHLQGELEALASANEDLLRKFRELADDHGELPG